MAKRISKKKRKSIRAVFTYITVFTVVTLIAWGYNYVDSYLQEQLATFRLADIDIKGNQILSRTQVLELCGLKANDSKLLELKPSEVVQSLRRSPYIKAASAVRSLPATLRIVIQEREPVAFIYGRGLNLIDADGYLMPVPRSHYNWNLPFITGINQPLGSLGEKSTSELACLGAEILDYTRYMNSPLVEVISEINMNKGSDLHMRLIQGGAMVRLDRNNYRENLYLLSQYFKKYLDWERLTVIEYFDVRFKDQLIIKEKQG